MRWDDNWLVQQCVEVNSIANNYITDLIHYIAIPEKLGEHIYYNSTMYNYNNIIIII